VELLKLVIFQLMQRRFADIVRCVVFCNIYIMKALNGFLMTQMTLNDICG